ncbi:SSU rRNA (adenine(1518)-N(6)/adenine(1519)-N(6))-dimethyltransferase [Candidatus Syntrophocurvum alkaliphilum]|uniref:Ribosomal RNA small subunit methyltransferase A n=1 Tax=Candidatus Syntrophocurvum alkaliphilum TaxID=2293317 RepID=A0A6I6DDJ0_9FIRM|nr:16S rRNA (adenine(1518)-N(6)/adenine(1519)-N(6))-dimethyltransferase RsmA [Candidatus Syntrophocurvum alkaliphilum]QGU00572.1 SSU rRNA (adenine(1518)-N(6)/adenine(1519)-N(6))-dimethyltransferase [Candidatus Syntrophocurvum alkaliphilum]
MANPYTITEVKKLIHKHNLHPKKRFGQNFLVDQNILNKIVGSCQLTKQDYVVEIGPGFGALTQKLAEHSKKVIAIDVDTSLDPVLKEVLKNYDNVNIIYQDILNINLENEITKQLNLQEVQPYKICANIPYNISTPILFTLLENCPNMTSATLMMQKEVAFRLIAKPGTKDYGLLTIMAAYHSNIDHVMNVSKNCFYPKPEVESTVIRITPDTNKKKIVKNEIQFKKFVKTAFQKRRKTILNICASHFKVEKSVIIEKLQNEGIKPESRPENLTLEDFALVTDLFY